MGNKTWTVELPRPVQGNLIRLLVNGSEALPELLRMLDQARTSIRMQVMLFDPDEIGFEIARHLAQAAGRGVRVQLSFNIVQTVNGTIADHLSHAEKQKGRRAMAAMLEQMGLAGVEVRANPAGIPRVRPGLGAGPNAILRETRAHIRIPMNHYDHRKILVVDDSQVLLGGMNVGRSYYYHHPIDIELDMLEEAQLRRQAGLPEAWEKWLDTSFLVEGPAAAQAALEFDWKWEALGGHSYPPEPPAGHAGGVPLQLLVQRPGRGEAAARFFELVSSAGREIFVASPFVSYEPALEALQDAARRGVRVVFVYPHARQEMPVSRRIFLNMASGLVRAGIELYFNDLRMAHSKLLVVDGTWVMFGSFNLNYRSFLHDLEITGVAQDAALAREVAGRVFADYLAISRRVEFLPPPRRRPVDRIIKFFS